MKELVSKKRINNVSNMDWMGNAGIISMRLNEVHELLESKYEYIQYQKNEIDKHKRDNLRPSEGQYPGYDNSIRISPVNSVDVIKRSVGELNEYAIWSNDEIVSEKKEIINECDKLHKHLSELNSEYQVIDDKEQALKQVTRLLKKTLELMEEMNKVKQS